MPDIDQNSLLLGQSVNKIIMEFNTALFANLDGFQVRFGS
jgi:hypothetical protein